MTDDVQPAHRLRLVFAIAIAVVLLDQSTKHWAISELADRDHIHVVWTLQWNLAYNSGMAFSKGQGIGPIIGLLALVVVAVIVRSVSRQTSLTAAVAAGLVLGGAMGNLVDRLFRGRGWLRGEVIDFIDFQWFPIFNVADIAVNVGGAVFVLWSLFGSHQARSA